MLALACLAGASEPQVHFITHSLAGAVFKDKDGHLRGVPGGGRRAFLIEVVHAMMMLRGKPGTIEEVPLPRGHFLLAHEKDYAFFNVVRNRDREHKYKWVGPIYDQENYFYDHADRPTGISSLDDARAVRAICAVRGTNIVSWFERHGFTNIVTANSFGACVQMLDYGRVDLVQSAEHPAVIKAKVGPHALVRTSVKVEDKTDGDEDMNLGYIAFATTVTDREITAWQAALDALKASGEFERLKTVYLVPVAGKPAN